MESFSNWLIGQDTSTYISSVGIDFVVLLRFFVFLVVIECIVFIIRTLMGALR